MRKDRKAADLREHGELAGLRLERQYQTAGCSHVALEVSYSTYPAILDTIDILAEEIRPLLDQRDR